MTQHFLPIPQYRYVCLKTHEFAIEEWQFQLVKSKQFHYLTMENSDSRASRVLEALAFGCLTNDSCPGASD